MAEERTKDLDEKVSSSGHGCKERSVPRYFHVSFWPQSREFSLYITASRYVVMVKKLTGIHLQQSFKLINLRNNVALSKNSDDMKKI